MRGGVKQNNIFDYLPKEENELVLQSSIEEDAITQQISRIFDYQFDGTVKETITIPKFDKDFQIGLIVGSSGSGKSTILHNNFGYEENIEWDNNKCIASHFESFEEASNKFGAVGLNSIPTWLKPYRVLSNGEKFRADLARRLKDGAVIDEFTSVVNRECAVSCSTSISKYIKKNNMKNIVFCSCHDDIIPYLSPTWVYNTDTHEFYNGRYLCRPKIDIKIHSCTAKTWDMFKRHHYLSGDLNKASTCYVATYKDIPIAFVALLALPGRDVKHAWREHRVVVLPDYQGMGIGNKLSETIAQAYREKGCQYFAKTSNPRMGEHRDKSPLWRPTINNHKNRVSYFDANGNVRANMKYCMNKEMVAYHAQRVCYTHEYIGDGTVYPYTYGSENVEIEMQQMSIFDFPWFLPKSMREEKKM